MGIPRLDTLVKVSRGTRLELDAGQVPGQIQLKSWDRNEVSVSGPSNAGVSVRNGALHVVEAPAERGRSNNRSGSAAQRSGLVGNNGRGAAARPRSDSVNWQVMVPTWMAMDISAGFAQVSVEGAGATVEVDAFGSINVTGGSGRVTATSHAGSVTIENNRGQQVTAEATNGMVRVIGTTAEILRAESVNGSVRLERVDARQVYATSVNADVEFDGLIRDQGKYRLTSHNGRVRVAIPETSNVTVMATSYRGAFSNAFPVTAASTGRSQGRGGQAFTMGTGSAELVVTSFNGNVEFVRSTGR